MKKDLPLVLLETLEKFVHLRGKQFEVIPPKDFLLKIVDKDKNSDFYFYIKSYKIDNGLKLSLDWKPASAMSTANRELWISVKELDNTFNTWISILDSYESVNSFYDDPIINKFAEEFYAEFQIIDEDAEIVPLNTKQILLLDNHLEYIENNIENYQTEQNIEQIQEIKNDIKELRENLTSKSKAWVIKNLSTIWAKVTKQGTKLMKEFLTESRKQLIIEGVKLVIVQVVNQIK